MSGNTYGFNPAGRDAALGRLRVFNGVLIGAAVAFTGLLADVAAQAFPGHNRTSTSGRATGQHTGHRKGTGHRSRHSSTTRRRPRASHHTPAAGLAPPAQAPSAPSAASTATSSAPAPAPAPSSTASQSAAPAPSPAPAPAPVVSGGS